MAVDRATIKRRTKGTIFYGGTQHTIEAQQRPEKKRFFFALGTEDRRRFVQKNPSRISKLNSQTRRNGKGGA